MAEKEIFSKQASNLRRQAEEKAAKSALRKLSPDIPVILSSGYDEAQVMAGEHIDRPNAFLGKPYQLKGLKDTISRVLS